MRKKATKAGICINSLCLFVLVAILVGTDVTQVHAATKQNKKTASATVGLNKKTASVTVGKKIKLTVQNASAKVKWKSSNKKIANIKSTSGKKKQNAIVFAKKKGNCKIIAQVGKKTVKCSLKVKASVAAAKPDDNTSAVTKGAIGVSVTNVIASKSALSVTAVLFNGSMEEKEMVSFGYDYSFQRKVNGQWIEVESKEPVMIPTILCILKPGEITTHTFILNETKKPMVSGEYRLATSLATNGSTPCDPYAYFMVTIP